MKMEMPGMAGMRGMSDSSMAPGPFGVPLNRMGSGTAWLPDAAPMHAHHILTGRWTIMLHGFAFGMYDAQGGPRGSSQLSSTNWGMIMAMHPLGGGLLHLHGMLSLEPFTVGARGYPLLLQNGESYQGQPIHDRQHPHDLFMEISAMFERQLTRQLAWSLYLAPVGEPAAGPVAFPHRPSAQNDPFAPIAHHWQDATHITYGVITGGLYTKRVKLEGSIFNGREPDANRTDFDFRRLDSYAARLSVNPSPRWSLATWYDYLRSPEELHPADAQHRVGASALRTATFGTVGEWSAGLIWGAVKHDSLGAWLHSFVLENDVALDRRNSVFGRVEYVRKTAEDLVIPNVASDTRYDLGALALGYARELFIGRVVTLGAGVRGSMGLVPESLRGTYGSRTPVGGAIFLHLRPSRTHS